jgi:hypothetical protein
MAAGTPDNSGDTFTFTIDVDTTGQQVTGGDIAGSQVTATFDTSGPVSATMVVGAPTGNWASPAPEPNTLVMLGFGLTGRLGLPLAALNFR